VNWETARQRPPRPLAVIDVPCRGPPFHTRLDEVSMNGPFASPVPKLDGAQSSPDVGFKSVECSLLSVGYDPEEADPSIEVLVEIPDACPHGLPPVSPSQLADLRLDAIC